MFITNHALAGALIGLVVPHPGAAFVAGLASHVAMDRVLHWGDERVGWDEFVRVARVDGTVGLGVSGLALAAAAPALARPSVAAGIAGACLIDMDKAGEHFFGRSPFPAAVDRFHARIQNERPIGLVCEALAAPGPAAALARPSVAAGIAGACLIDMDKAGEHFFGRSPFPAAVDRFHARIQNERPIGLVVEALAAAGLAAALVALRRRRRRAA